MRDRQIEAAADADTRAARLVAQEFDAFLALVERDEGPACAGLFLARCGGELGKGTCGDARDLAPVLALAAADRLVRTGVATAGDVDVSDLDPLRRDAWSAEQWRRAEAAGLLALAAARAADDAPVPQYSQHSGAFPQVCADDPVWWDDAAEAWRTAFPPADGFDGEEEACYGDPDCARALHATEKAALAVDRARSAAERRAIEEPLRAAWFAALLEGAGPGPGVKAAAETAGR